MHKTCAQIICIIILLVIISNCKDIDWTEEAQAVVKRSYFLLQIGVHACMYENTLIKYYKQ